MRGSYKRNCPRCGAVGFNSSSCPELAIDELSRTARAATMWLTGVRAYVLRRDISLSGLSLTAQKLQAHRAAWIRMKTQQIIEQMKVAP